MSEFTEVLQRAQCGDPKAAEELFPLIYENLRQLAASKMAREAPGQTLQPTALVHEAWLRMGADQQPIWRDRAQFFAAAAEAMRRILIDRARQKATAKHGAGQRPEELNETQIELQAPPEEILAINDALDELARVDAAAAEVVKLRYFVGFSVQETADVLSIAPRTVNRHWSFARAWLKEQIESPPPPGTK